jgi:hypothetical protein
MDSIEVSPSARDVLEMIAGSWLAQASFASATHGLATNSRMAREARQNYRRDWR